ncbi:chloride channel protein [uncultured Adlercreutzia sp.]|uniref:chloride channel protein n=1 Tax=uncultured Adlercreutzia sp. TaxID=875803 RepID=UPI0025D05523|nr:chloride channel protein [uncultured Adlercreutzia sp.]MCI9260879.1 chloride channel protein [Eggerthellaceae bacterium]
MAKKVLFALFTIAFGAFAGAFAWGFFFLMNTGIALLWEAAPNALAAQGLPAVFYPLVFCTIGGVVIGLFAKKFGPYPADMNTVMASVKQTGRYEYDHMGASFFGALLPLLFGGSIGPEAGMTGVIAGLCTWVGDRLRFVGAEMRELAEASCAAVIAAIFATPLFGLMVPAVGAADDSDGPRRISEVRLDVAKPLKIAAYVLAVAGALGAMALLGHWFGAGGGLPHFSEIAFGAAELAWALPLMAVGTMAGWLYFPAGAAARALATRLGNRPIAKAVTAGVLLGAVGTALPFALFAGEAQTEQLALIWTTIGAGVLLATGFAKVIVTQFCLNLGWRGGHFFPLIFAGIALGYGLATLTGIDSVFALCAVTGALMGAVMRQPLMTAVLLFLVFPLAGAPVLLVAAALGSLVPVPHRWLGK